MLVPQPEQHQTTGPPHQTTGPPHQTTGPPHESAGSSHTPKSATKRKRCDDYEERFLQKFTRVQEENAGNARATNKDLKAVTDAFIKIAAATNERTTVAQVNSQSNERMAAAISQLAETIGNYCFWSIYLSNVMLKM